jgi:hypothetical protein
MINNSTLQRKVRTRNLHTGRACLSRRDMADYWNGKFTRLDILDEEGNILESYYGYGLRKLIASAVEVKDEEFVLVTRHLKK